MTEHHCMTDGPVRPPSGVTRKRQDYDETHHVMVDLVKMDDGRWLVTFSRYVPGPDGDLIEQPEPAMYVTNPPSYLPSDVDVDVWLAADLASNVVLHQTSLGHSPVRGGRQIQELSKYV